MADITYKFIVREIEIDSVPTNTTYGTSSAATTNFSSFENSNFPGLQRDEIYRYGIIFFDKKMKPSFVKYLLDVRVPDVDVYPIMKNDTTANSIHLEFTVTDLPSSVQAYQIVSVPRTLENRTVIDMGYVNGIDNDGFQRYNKNGLFAAWNLLDYTSPETVYNKLDTRGEFIQQIGAWGVAKNTDINTGDDRLELVKTKHLPLASLSLGKSTVRISDTQVYKYTSNIENTVNFGSISFLGKLVRNALEGVKGTTNMIQLNGFASTWGGSKNNTHGSTIGVIARRRKGLIDGVPQSLYGNRESSVFVPCSDIKRANESVVVTWGDTYIGFFEFHRAMYDPSGGEDKTRYGEVLFMPLESTINFNFIYNPTINQLVPLDVSEAITDSTTRYRFMQEIKGVHGSGNNAYIQDFDLYTYNSVYSRANNSRSYVMRPSTLRKDNAIDTRIYHSERKLNVELEDGWLVFRSFLDVDTAYGSITRLFNFKNNLYFFQDKACGVLSVDQRELANTDAATSLTLGVGGILDRYDYLSNNSGTSIHDSITQSKAGLYYVDNINKAICRVGEIPIFLTDENMKSWTKKLKFTKAIASYDGTFNSILFNVDDEYTLVYNENLQKFTEFYTFKPDKFIQLNNKSLHTVNNNIYSLDVVERGVFGDTSNYSKISFVINPEGRFIQRLDVIELLTIVLDSNGEELQETVSTIRVHNSYQDSGVISIDDEVAVRRFRNWRINNIRDKNDDDDARLKDTYFILEITFTNKSNKLIKLDDIVINTTPVRPY